MKKLKKHWAIILLIFLFIGGLFYWYEWRPSKIKQNCSWVHKTSEAIPARAAKSKEEIENCKNENKDRLFCDLFSEPVAAQPAKDWWEPATTLEYNFCIHEKGL